MTNQDRLPRQPQMKQDRWLTEAINALVDGAHGDPFSLLGPYETPDGLFVRVFCPGADHVEIVAAHGGEVAGALHRVHDGGVFAGILTGRARFLYKVRAHHGEAAHEYVDPYQFGPVLGETDIYLISEGTHLQIFEKLGAHLMEIGGVEGTAFSTWAPNARRVSVVGDFNRWDGRVHPMRLRPECGVWELFLPHVEAGAPYKFELKGPEGQLLPLKSDPFAFAAEHPPKTGSLVHGTPRYRWSDESWIKDRAARQHRRAPMSIYEIHTGSWMRVPEENNRYLTYDELGDKLIPYAVDMGFTHLEFMPISEFPFDGSWGYQPLGLFAPTRRHGSPADFARFVDRCHAAGLGVLLDWVPGHFPSDEHGIGYFDGTHLYEHADPRKGFHLDWNTLIYNYGRTEVRNFLLANALFWLDKYHVDGLRVDAVASMLYLDYSREEGGWIPNEYGGRENLEAISFLKRLNELVYAHVPGAAMMAEESTAWPGVSQPVYAGGLGFGFKWNMGWMHDTLGYMSEDPVHRRYHHNEMTFGLLYAFTENFILPLSHDEVVHGKGSILSRMPGDEWKKFANLRAYYAFMFAYPGKKLLFMGNEFAQANEWSHQTSLDWHLIGQNPLHKGVQMLVRDLNALYRSMPPLYERDCEADGFAWSIADDYENSVFAFMRYGGDRSWPVLAVSNFTPVVRHGYRVGVPVAGQWHGLLNTDAADYGGSNVGNTDIVTADSHPINGYPYSVELTLPPLSTLILSIRRN